jgi:hypothetical protein
VRLCLPAFDPLLAVVRVFACLPVNICLLSTLCLPACDDKYEAAVTMQNEAAYSKSTILITKLLNEVYSTGDGASLNELKENDLYKLDPNHDDLQLDIVKVLASTNSRFTKVSYVDASFAVVELK